ncbi:ATP-binding cassette domain-containing protein [Fibrobacter sp.]|uniref:ATP-binding cassette domain-containing protein n=1 Tax=Fibrobacter sp. TaxID=35828 RepID=UPI00388EB1DD
MRFLPLALLASVADAAMLWGIRSFMDLLNSESVFTLAEWVAIMALLTTLRLLFLFAKTKSSESFLYDTGTNIANWFLHTIRSLSPKLFHTSEGDSMVEAAYDSTIVLQNNGGVFFQAVQAVLQLAIFLPVLLFISWPLTLFLFAVIVPLVAWIQRKLHAMGPEEESLLYAKSKYRADLNRTRRLYRYWSSLFERSSITSSLRNDARVLGERSLKASIRKNGLSLTMETVSVLSMVLVLAFCAFLISKNWMDGTGLVMFCSALLLCYKPVKECARALPQFRSTLSAYRLLIKFSHLPQKDMHIPASGTDLCIKDAGFGYSNSDTHVFMGLNENFSEGVPVLLRGKNGSGKSTLLRLLAELEEWDLGQMKIMAKSRMRGIFFVAQDLELPPRNLLQQLLDQEPNPEIEQFIQLANARKLLKKEGLSGGERARVALVWALASKAHAILLDEPFAAVALNDRGPLLSAFLETARKQDKWVVIASHDELPQELEKQFRIMDMDHV